MCLFRLMLGFVFQSHGITGQSIFFDTGLSGVLLHIIVVFVFYGDFRYSTAGLKIIQIAGLDEILFAVLIHSLICKYSAGNIAAFT